MSAPIYFIGNGCYLPTVEALNERLNELGYEARIAEPELWPDRPYGKLAVIRGGKETNVFLSKDTVRSKGEYFARILSKVAPQPNASAEIDKIEAQYGDQVVETCYGWTVDGVAAAEVNRAFASLANARLWRPNDRVSVEDILSAEETDRELASDLAYQTEQAVLIQRKRSEQNHAQNQ